MKAKLLLIDDDVDFVRITKSFLESAGFDVDVAYDGGEGLEKARKDKPDLIFLDYMMLRPTEGAFVAQELKDDPQLKEVPILLLTAISSVHPWWGVQKDDRYLPVDVFIDKPVKPERLVEEIKRLLKQ